MSDTRVYVGGLEPGTSTADLEQFFQQYGSITDCIALSDRGFGFVTFEDPDVAASVIGKSLEFNGRNIDVKRSAGKGGGGKGKGKGDVLNSDKCFVGGLAAETTEGDLKEHFGKYGVLTDCTVMMDRSTGRSRGFGFVRFETSASVDDVMEDYSKHTINGKWVDVKRAVPEERMVRTKGGVPIDDAPPPSSQAPVPPPSGYAAATAYRGAPPPSYPSYPMSSAYAVAGSSAPTYDPYQPAPSGYMPYGSSPYGASAYGSSYGSSPYGGYNPYAPPPSCSSDSRYRPY
mmetsp:Transcript_41279/g.108353  ORF Transcript_41279/g.108353 Transcript_41279/m.108353 type:complete len:287 (-) Transcript_41279:37-897(-)